MKVWLNEEDVLMERWAIRVATITSDTVDYASPFVKRFRSAGGDEELFTKLEKLVCEKGWSFVFLLDIVATMIPREMITGYQTPSLNALIKQRLPRAWYS